MALDATDQKLIKGAILFAILALILYFWPFESPLSGYASQLESLERTRTELNDKKVRGEYEKNYPPVSNAVWGMGDEGESAGARGSFAADIKAAFVKKNELNLAHIRDKQAANRMAFADWTEVPAQERDLPGFYFQRVFEAKRKNLHDKCRRANVDVVDYDIGFGDYSGVISKDPKKARELLRELFIAEMIIDLCVKAKLDQEESERKDGKQREAFMRIIQVAPEVSSATGPVLRKPNDTGPDKYDPKETNPRSKKFQRYFIIPLAKFIQMYPVKIVLQCDSNSFMRFLHAVREEPGHFLVIQKIEMLSPLLRESQVNTSELKTLEALLPDEKGATFDENHIWVRLSAAGMDFFDPEKGSIDVAKGDAGSGPTQRRPSKDRSAKGPKGH
ncbi:MAG: hypothetical protein M5U26_10610 [Planctomycetota bacterium]|nr:hypothetical protein [Planctomycetota bacterium]